MSLSDTCECPKFGIDYYGVLGITKNAHDLDIKKAFRRLAIKHNPERSEQKETSQATFFLIAEAYDVLSDPFKRTVYDQYGEAGLKNGVPGPENYIQPYIYHGEPLRTYREFFGTTSPYADLLDVLWNPVDVYELPTGRGIKHKDESIVHPLPLTLSEIFFGGLKKMKIQRYEFVDDKKIETVLKEKILTIPIKPGLQTGTEIIFHEEGDQGPTKIPADIIFVTEDRYHETFKRVGANLCMTVKIFLQEALVGTVVTINTIDERILRVPVTSTVVPDYEKLIKGEGLPLMNNPEKRGDLVIKFDVEFPVYLPLASKNYVKKAFKDYRTRGNTSDPDYIRRVIQANKIRRTVDDDIPLWRDRDNDELEKLKLLCET